MAAQPPRYFLLEEASSRISDAVGRLIASAQNEDLDFDFGLLLLSSACDHVSQSEEGSAFSCGFRNMQMLLSALQYEGHLYLRPLLQELSPEAASGALADAQPPFIPDLVSMQTWLDHAWRSGFDADGAAQMGEAVSGTDKWVGAGEAVALLRSLGVAARSVVLHAFDSPFLGAAIGDAAAVLGNVAQIQAAEVLYASAGLTPEQVVEPSQSPPQSARSSTRNRAPSWWEMPGPPKGFAEVLAAAAAAVNPFGGGVRGGPWRSDRPAAADDDDDDEVVVVDDDEDDGLPAPPATKTKSSSKRTTGNDDDDDDEIVIVEPRGGGASAKPAAAPAPQPPRAVAAPARPVLAARPAAPPLPVVPVNKATAMRRYSLARHSTLIQWLLAYFLLPGRDPAAVITSCRSELAAALRRALADGLDACIAPGSLPGGGRPLPLYFQHDGHSRTLVGLELRQAPGSKRAAAAAAAAASAAHLSSWLNGGAAKRPRLDGGGDGSGAGGGASEGVHEDGDSVLSQLADVDINLLLLDPSSASASLRTALSDGKWGRFIRRSICTFRKPVYELVVVTPEAAVRAEAEVTLGGAAAAGDAFARFCESHAWLSKSVSQEHNFLG